MRHISESMIKIASFAKYVLLLTGVLIASLCIAGGLYTSDIKNLLVFVNGTYTEIVTRADTVGDALAEAGIVIEPGQTLNYSPDCKIEDVDTYVTTTKSETMNVVVDGKTVTVPINGGTVGEALADMGISISGNDILQGGNIEDMAQNGMTVSILRVEYEEITNIEYLDYEIRYVAAPEMLEGKEDVISEGTIGYEKTVFRIEKRNGVEVGRELIHSERKEPIDRLIYYGTKEYFQSSRGDIIVYSEVFYDMIATAYSPTPENWGYQTYTGNTNREGGIAVDPTVIPLNTKVYIKSNIEGVPDYGYAVAWDIGKSIKGNKVDLFMESEATCVKWGIKGVTVYILEDQSVDVFALRGDSFQYGD